MSVVTSQGWQLLQGLGYVIATRCNEHSRLCNCPLSCLRTVFDLKVCEARATPPVCMNRLPSILEDAFDPAAVVAFRPASMPKLFELV